MRGSCSLWNMVELKLPKAHYVKNNIDAWNVTIHQRPTFKTDRHSNRSVGVLYFYFFPRTLSHWLNSLDLAKLPVRWHLLPRLMKDEWKVKLKTPIITCYKCVTQYIKVRIGIDWLSRNRYSVHACMSRHKQLIITWSWKNSGGNMRIFPGVKEVKDTFSQYGYRSKRTGPSSNQLWFSDSTWDALSLNVN